MIALAVVDEAGNTLAFFRHQRQAEAYLAAHSKERAPIFKAVKIVSVLMDENLWTADYDTKVRLDRRERIQ